MTYSENIADYSAADGLAFGVRSYLYESGTDECGYPMTDVAYVLAAEVSNGTRWESDLAGGELVLDKTAEALNGGGRADAYVWHFSGHAYGSPAYDREDEIALMDDDERRARGV